MVLWKDDDLEITHIRASGPGGQNRNKRMSGVRIRHLPTGLVVTATERRSQAQNLSVATRRLKERLQLLTKIPKKRVATRPTRGSQNQRLEEKKHRSRIKAGRSGNLM
jgi:protein subunit release factor B